MSTVTLRGNPVNVAGDFPAIGSTVADFTLTAADLSEVSLGSVSGNKILNIFPSIDTPTCAMSVRKFNEQAAGKAAVLCISADLPFAQKRFCGAEGIEQVQTLSTFRHPEFLEALGVKLASGPLAGLTARAVLVLDAQNTVLHAEMVPEIGSEPNYAAALAVL